MNEIEVSNLTHDYNGHGIYDISFKANKGEVLGFLGPNGAGKSTTMRHLMGFVKAQSGKATIHNMDSFLEYDKIKDHVGYLPGEVNMIDSLTGYDFINIQKGLFKNVSNERIEYLINRFELNCKTKIKRMSVGERRKLAIVVAFMSDSDILLLDEPTSGLDPIMQREFIKFILEQKNEGKTILLSSHIFNEVEALCDRVLIIKDGRIISEVGKNDIKHSLERLHNVTFKNLKDLKEFKSEVFFEIKEYIEDKNYISISLSDDKTNELIKIISKYDIEDYDQVSLSLEEYFMRFYRDNKKMGGF